MYVYVIDINIVHIVFNFRLTFVSFAIFLIVQVTC